MKKTSIKKKINSLLSRCKKFFGEQDLSYKKIILLAVGFGIFAGIVNRIPFLYRTSIQDIAIVLDVWVLAAIFIVVNSKKWQEAVIKCFLFFLISQPLVYLVEASVDALLNGADFLASVGALFRSYYFGGSYWGVWTLLTIPGSFIAFQIKKNNALAAIVLSVATGYLAFACSSEYVHSYSHILSKLFCIFSCILLIFVILNGKKERIIAGAISVACFIAGFICIAISAQAPIVCNAPFDVPEGFVAVEILVDDTEIATVSEDSEGDLTIYSGNKVGSTKIHLKDADGNEIVYTVDSSAKNFAWELVEQ